MTTPPTEPSLDMLQGITRQLATAEDLETVLRSIASSLVERADAALARIFLLRRDRECPVCRERIERTGSVEGEEGRLLPPSETPALHVAVSCGAITDVGALNHRIALDSPLPPGEAARTGAPVLIDDWKRHAPLARSAEIARRWHEWGVVGAAAYPLEFQGEMLGTIAYLATRRLAPHEFAMLGIFADQAAMAIKSAYLFRELGRVRDRLEDENAYLQGEVRDDHDFGFEDIVGGSQALRSVVRKIRQVAPVETTVLITGETGTGKELVARAIHQRSPRRERPLIKVNCGAIPQGMVESELFGHEKGAFTGAIQRRIGRFELADKGTLFMDEVGELSLDTQVRLLRVLQEREFERVGSATVTKVDVRLVAATHRDLEREVAEGRFRADLFYRLNVFPIRIPALRERPDDIPLLVTHFLAHFQRKLGKPLREMAPASLEQLRRYAWPGNIRELQNVLERACVLARGPVVELADPLRAAPGQPVAATDAPILTLDDSERAHIRRALAAANGRVHGPNGAAALLGVNPSTLRSRMQRLEIGKAG